MSLRVNNISFGELPKVNETLQQTTHPTAQVTQPQALPDNAVKNSNFIKDNLPAISSGLAVVSLCVAGIAIAKGKDSQLVKETSSKLSELGGKVDKFISELTENVSNAKQKNNEIDNALKTFEDELNAIRQKAENNAALVKEGGWYDNFIKALDAKIQNLQAAKTYSITHPLERNVGFIDGMPLLRNVDNAGNPIKLDDEMKLWLNTAASRYINNGRDHIDINKLSKDSSVWALTFESKPEKEGGLGEVPVQIAKNFKEIFNINNPIVRPMSLIPGKSQLIEENGKFVYRYNIRDPKPWKMEVNKVAEFETQVVRNGKAETQPVQVFTGVDPQFNVPRIMFANNDYFTSPGLYKNTQKVTESERCVFFAKISYEFAKYLRDPGCMTNIKICNPEALAKIKAPDAMILNDWHAAAMAPLLRFKAQMEAKAGELSKKAADSLTSTNLLHIDHNLDYQGTNFEQRADILNTLFDKYTYDIYENAKTGFEIKDLESVYMTGDNVNLANMGASVSHIERPVGVTYSWEICEQPRRSGYMQHILKTRYKQGTLGGRNNGWDRALNEVSSANIGGFNNSINSDKFEIFKKTIEGIKGLDSDTNKKIATLFEGNLNYKNFKVLIEELRKMEIPSITAEIENMERSGITNLRRFNPYTYADNPADIMHARKQNKRLFIEYINSMNEYNKNVKKIFNIVDSENTNLSDISSEELDQTIVFNMGVRFVSQKGVDVACNAIRRVLTEWESKFPGKRKPIFVIGGEDAEGGRIKKLAYDLKKELGADLGKQLVYQDGYTKNNIFQAGSDFTLYSSHFEPDGAKWESLYKGTPVICTRVGGHVDNVYDGVNGFLTKRTVPEIDNVTSDQHGNRIEEKYLTEFSNDFTDAIYRAVDTFYAGDKYTDMVMNAIRGDQSWVIKDTNGNIIGGPALGYLSDLGYNLRDFPNITEEAIQKYQNEIYK